MMPSFAQWIWHNGRIKPLSEISFPLCIELAISEVEFIDEVICYSTSIIGIGDVYKRLVTFVKIYGITAPLFSDTTGELLGAEIKRLHVRNNCYKWSVCHIWCRLDQKTATTNVFLLLSPSTSFFEKKQTPLMACAVSRLPKPMGNAINLPDVYKAYLRMAILECRLQQCDLGLLLCAEDAVIDTTHGNLFLVKNDTVYVVWNELVTFPSDFMNMAIEHLHRLKIRTEFIGHASFNLIREAQEIFVVGNKGIFSIKGFEAKRYYERLRIQICESFMQSITEES